MKNSVLTWLALVATFSYVSCSSDDAKKTLGTGGSAGSSGSGGASGGSGGSKASGGSAGKGGSAGSAGKGGTGGQGGDTMSGGVGGEPAVGGAGGEPVVGGAGGEAGGGDAGAAGAGTNPLPAGCPGTLADYDLGILTDTDGNNYFDYATLNGSIVVLGLDGDDSFQTSFNGADCLVGGPGNDEFYSGESSRQTFIGGPGDDDFILTESTTDSAAYIVDMKAEGADKIHLASFTFLLTGTTGDTPDPAQVLAIADFAGGNVATGAAVRLVYDPTDGELWWDQDGSATGFESVLVAELLNHPPFDLNDYVLY